MMIYRFHDAAGNTTDFGTSAEAEAFAAAQGYVFVTRRSLVEGLPESIVYYVHEKDIPGPAGSADPGELFRLLLMKYREWEEPRIMPVDDSGKPQD